MDAARGGAVPGGSPSRLPRTGAVTLCLQTSTVRNMGKNRLKLSTLALVSALGVVALAGCTTTPISESAPAQTPSSVETPALSPTPEAMSVEAAADYYLDTVCPANAASATWNLNTAAGDFASYKAGAQPLADAYSEAAARFDDPAVLWPAEIKLEDISVLSGSYYADVSVLQGIANANTEADATFTFASRDLAAAASQKIRARLGLPSDTTTSCRGR